jgi:hypothetical protein
MTTDRIVRIVAGLFILVSLSFGIPGCPALPQYQMAMVHGLRGRQPIPERVHPVLPAGDHPEKTGRQDMPVSPMRVTNNRPPWR